MTDLRYGCNNCGGESKGKCRHEPPCELKLPMILQLIEPDKINNLLTAFSKLKMRINIIGKNDFQIVNEGG